MFIRRGAPYTKGVFRKGGPFVHFGPSNDADLGAVFPDRQVLCARAAGPALLSRVIRSARRCAPSATAMPPIRSIR